MSETPYLDIIKRLSGYLREAMDEMETDSYADDESESLPEWVGEAYQALNDADRLPAASDPAPADDLAARVLLLETALRGLSLRIRQFTHSEMCNTSDEYEPGDPCGVDGCQCTLALVPEIEALLAAANTPPGAPDTHESAAVDDLAARVRAVRDELRTKAEEALYSRNFKDGLTLAADMLTAALDPPPVAGAQDGDDGEKGAEQA